MPTPDNNQKDLVKDKAKASFITRLAVFDAIANPILGIGKNIFETGKAVFDAVLGNLTYGLETLSDSLTKLSGHSNNMGIASAALNGIETLLLSPLSFYLRYKDKQAKQESMSWHTKAKFVYGIVVFAATIFAMAFPPAAIAVNIVIAASGVVASGISLYRNIKRRFFAGDDSKSANLNTESAENGKDNSPEPQQDKIRKVPDNTKIAHKTFGGLLAIAALVAVGLAASGGGLLVAAGIVGAVVAALSTVQLFTKIGEAIYRWRSGATPVEIEPVNNPEPESVRDKQVVQERTPTIEGIQAIVAEPRVPKVAPVFASEPDISREAVQSVRANDQQSPVNDVAQKLLPSSDDMKKAVRELKQSESSLGTGLYGLGNVRFKP